MHRCFLTEIPLMLQKLILDMKQMHGSRIWMKMKNGKLQRKVKNRLTLIWNILL